MIDRSGLRTVAGGGGGGCCRIRLSLSVGICRDMPPLLVLLKRWRPCRGGPKDHESLRIPVERIFLERGYCYISNPLPIAIE